MAIQSFPRLINPKIKKQTDDQLAKVGQLNQLVKDVNALNVTGPSPAGIPFEWYPPAGLTTGGVKFKYTDGVELISYHIKGMLPVSLGVGESLDAYLCTVNFPNEQPFLFPGSITGMVQCTDVFDSNRIITTPLGNGGVLASPGEGNYEIALFRMTLNQYGNNPQPDGSFNYALLMSFDASGFDVSGLISYDYEFLLPNFVTSPTIFQD